MAGQVVRLSQMHLPGAQSSRPASPRRCGMLLSGCWKAGSGRSKSEPWLVSSITPDAVRDMTIGLDYRGLDGGETGRFDYYCYLYRF